MTAPLNIRELAYFALVRPQVEYAASAWSPWLLHDITKLEKLQRRSARFVSKNYHQTASVSNMIDELGWESLENRRKKMRVQMLYKILNNIVLPGPTPTTRMESPHYDLRGYHPHICPLHCRTDTFKHSFFPETIELWNNLPPQITTSSSLTVFKNHLHTHTL